MVGGPLEVVGNIFSVLYCFIVGINQQWQQQQLNVEKVVGPEEERRGREDDVHLTVQNC